MIIAGTDGEKNKPAVDLLLLVFVFTLPIVGSFKK
jgi:hypothetical protein